MLRKSENLGDPLSAANHQQFQQVAQSGMITFFFRETDDKTCVADRSPHRVLTVRHRQHLLRAAPTERQ